VQLREKATSRRAKASEMGDALRRAEERCEELAQRVSVKEVDASAARAELERTVILCRQLTEWAEQAEQHAAQQTKALHELENQRTQASAEGPASAKVHDGMTMAEVVARCKQLSGGNSVAASPAHGRRSPELDLAMPLLNSQESLLDSRRRLEAASASARSRMSRGSEEFVEVEPRWPGPKGAAPDAMRQRQDPCTQPRSSARVISGTGLAAVRH